MSIDLVTREGRYPLDRGTTVMFSTVHGLAFGPVFEQRDHAEAFLAWLAPKLDADLEQVSESRALALSTGSWKAYYAEFFEEKIDGETGELKAAPV